MVRPSCCGRQRVFADPAAADGASGRTNARTLLRFRCLFLERSNSSNRGWRSELSDCRPDRNGRGQWQARGLEVGVAAGAVELPLGVRSRRPGDRFHPLGAPGVRKLQDFFVDRKIARVARDRVPLVVDGRDRIVWVVGQSVAEDFRVTDPSRGVILLRVRHLGGVG